MTMTKVFKSGNSQAVRLPRQFRLRAAEVEIFQRGDEIVLREKARGLTRAFDLLANLPADAFSEPRIDPPAQKRREI